MTTPHMRSAIGVAALTLLASCKVAAPSRSSSADQPRVVDAYDPPHDLGPLFERCSSPESSTTRRRSWMRVRALLRRRLLRGTPTRAGQQGLCSLRKPASCTRMYAEYATTTARVITRPRRSPVAGERCGRESVAQTENTSVRSLPAQASNNAKHQQGAEKRHKESDAETSGKL